MIALQGGGYFLFVTFQFFCLDAKEPKVKGCRKKPAMRCPAATPAKSKACL